MKNSFKIFILLLVLVISPHFVFAQPVTAPPSTQPVGATMGQGTFTPLTNPLNNITSVGALVQKFVEVVSYLAVIFAVLLIIYTGLQFILARGAPEKIKEAKNRLIAILIGVAIVIGARVIITVIINTLDATGTLNEGTSNSIRRAVNSQ